MARLTNFGINGNVSIQGISNGTLYFTANDGTSGNELWKMDATGNPVLVGDIYSGSDPSQLPYSSNPGNFTDVNGTAYFTATNANNGTELWKLDATGNPTLAGDINTGVNPSNPANLTNVNGTLYFTADNGTNGNELWKIDSLGVPTLAADIYPGIDPANVANLTNVNGTLYFTADNGTSGNELWKIDATGNPVLAGDIYAGSDPTTQTPYSSDPASLTNVNGTLYFTANNGTSGNELWKIDATGNPVLVGDIYAGSDPTTQTPYSSNPANLTNVNGTLYFTADNGASGTEIWKMDATGNPVLAADVYAGSDPTTQVPYSSDPANLTNVNGSLYFSADNGVSGLELWKLDAAGNPSLVQDINPNGSSNPSSLTYNQLDNTLYFMANDGTSGDQIWSVPVI